MTELLCLITTTTDRTCDFFQCLWGSN